MSGECEIQLEAGMWVGKHIPDIRPDRGILVGAARFFASVLFSTIDQKGFRKLRRELNKSEKLFDLTAEEHEWGCNHLQVGALILQTYGFGIGAAQGLLSMEHRTRSLSDLNEEARRWCAGAMWIRAVLEDERAPEELEGHREFMPDSDTFAKLQRHVDDINERGASFDWITKTGSDLPQGIAEQISSLRADGHEQRGIAVEKPADLDPEISGPEILE